jgi:DNA-binding response OmpR family regulator
MKHAVSPGPGPVVALFNASDDTVEMVQKMLEAAGFACLIGCRFADLRKGHIDFDSYIRLHDPTVVVFDISPPYLENWQFFKTLRDSTTMQGRGLVLTTTNKDRLDEAAGSDSQAVEIVGKPYDLSQIATAIRGAIQAAAVQRGPAVPSSAV